MGKMKSKIGEIDNHTKNYKTRNRVTEGDNIITIDADNNKRRGMNGLLVIDKLKQKSEIPDFWSEVGLDVELLVLSTCEINVAVSSRIIGKKQQLREINMDMQLENWAVDLDHISG